MDRKRPRKNISELSRRHLSRLAKEESELICDSLLDMTTLSSNNTCDNTVRR